MFKFKSIRVDPGRSGLIRVDPTRIKRSELIRSEFCTCLLNINHKSLKECQGIIWAKNISNLKSSSLGTAVTNWAKRLLGETTASLRADVWETASVGSNSFLSLSANSDGKANGLFRGQIIRLRADSRLL